MPALPKSVYSGPVYRCFNSVKPSQELLDDIGLSEQEQEVLKSEFYDDELRTLKPYERVMRRAEFQILQDQIDGKFQPKGWMTGRFSDGTWPTLYTAESEPTSIAEKTYHLTRFYREEAQSQLLDIDLAIAKLEIHTQNLVDLSGLSRLSQQELTSKEKTSYQYCQGIARECIKEDVEALRSRSARDETGFCIPIFSKNAIKNDLRIRSWLKAEVDDGTITIYHGGETYRWQ